MDGARLKLDDGGFEVLDVGARRLEEIVDVGVATEDLEAGGGLGEGGGRFGPGVSDIVECGRRRHVFAVVGEAIADDLDEGQALEDGALGGDRLDDAAAGAGEGALAGGRRGGVDGITAPCAA